MRPHWPHPNLVVCSGNVYNRNPTVGIGFEMLEGVLADALGPTLEKYILGFSRENLKAGVLHPDPPLLLQPLLDQSLSIVD